MVISSNCGLFQYLHDNARFLDGRLVILGFKRLRQGAFSSHKLVSPWSMAQQAPVGPLSDELRFIGLGFHAIGGFPNFLKRSLRASDKRACWVCSHSMARIANCFLAASGI